ncbi:acrosin-like isoform X2 [Suricata suricatta]|uniref:acrosin-like isoform X2 n=1 Tax=Suricata suricatta TaxID=37032 RepID=UPI001155EDD3|nr:acrosin-like isoform X2 [Suricata suricatta]
MLHMVTGDTLHTVTDFPKLSCGPSSFFLILLSLLRIGRFLLICLQVDTVFLLRPPAARSEAVRLWLSAHTANSPLPPEHPHLCSSALNAPMLPPHGTPPPDPSASPRRQPRITPTQGPPNLPPHPCHSPPAGPAFLSGTRPLCNYFTH